jgi:hypothetical protein
MNIEQARKVMWLKSNPRPLGELLDEGYLTQDRLAWAAQWAYSHKLKQAAQVLLEEVDAPAPKVEERPKLAQEKSMPIKVSLDKARATPWPFSPHKGELMGQLVESKQLSLKDLVYAIENAWEERVKQAAIALTLLRLEQVVEEPVPSAGYVSIISGGRSYSKRRENLLTMLEGMILGFLLFVWIASIIWVMIAGSRPNQNSKSIGEFLSTTNGIIALIIVLGLTVLIGWLINFIPDQIMKSLDKQIEEHRLGQDGEDRAVQLIVQALDGNWHLFRNVSLPGRNKADLDLVLVGPPGVWALEVKNFRGKYRNLGEAWEYRRGKTWKKLSKSPSRQALNGAVRLGNFLKADHLDVFVNPAVVWANVESPLTVENPSVAVWLYDRLPDELGNIWQKEKLTEVERNKIADKLTKLCEGQKKSR